MKPRDFIEALLIALIIACDLKGSAGTLGIHQKATGHAGKEKLNVQS